jgi:hypothetical protein
VHVYTYIRFFRIPCFLQKYCSVVDITKTDELILSPTNITVLHLSIYIIHTMLRRCSYTCTHVFFLLNFFMVHVFIFFFYYGIIRYHSYGDIANAFYVCIRIIFSRSVCSLYLYVSDMFSRFL